MAFQPLHPEILTYLTISMYLFYTIHYLLKYRSYLEYSQISISEILEISTIHIYIILKIHQCFRCLNHQSIHLHSYMWLNIT